MEQQENKPNNAQGFNLPATVFNATKPEKTIVEITETKESGDQYKTVHSFNSEQEFLFYWQTPANFGFNDSIGLTYRILSQAEIAALLLPLQEQIVENEKQKVEAKRVFETGKQLAKELTDLVGFGYMFQDAAGIVYKTNQPTWKAVHYEQQEVQRTRFEGEPKGSLGMPEARAAGFIVEGK